MAGIPGSSHELLQNELTQRQTKNPSYSLRAFAQTLGLSPGYLSLLLNKQRQLSQDKAVKIARKLPWNQSRQKYFLTLVEYENTKTEKDKAHLLSELQKWARISRQAPLLEADQFALIAEWQHSAILAILTLPGFVGSLESISQRLNVPPQETKASLQRLQRLNLVREEDGVWQATNEELHIQSTPSAAIRAYHKEVLRKAMAAIETQPSEKRDFSNFIVTVDEKKIPEAKKKLFAFQQEMAQFLEGKMPSQLYQLSIQLFRVDQDGKGPHHDK